MKAETRAWLVGTAISWLAQLAFDIVLALLVLLFCTVPAFAWPRHGSGGGTPPVTIPDLLPGTGSAPVQNFAVQGSGNDQPAIFNIEELPYIYTKAASTFYVGGYGGTKDRAQLKDVVYCIKNSCVTVTKPSLNPRTGRWEYVFNPTSNGSTDGLQVVDWYADPVNGYQLHGQFPIYLNYNGTLQPPSLDRYVAPLADGGSNSNNGLSAATPYGTILFALGLNHVGDNGTSAGHLYMKCSTNPAAPEQYIEDQANSTSSSSAVNTVDVQCDPAFPTAIYANITRTNRVDSTAGASCTATGMCMIIGRSKVHFIAAVKDAITWDTNKIPTLKFGVVMDTVYHSAGELMFEKVHFVDPNGVDGPTYGNTECNAPFPGNSGLAWTVDTDFDTCSPAGALGYRNSTINNSFDAMEWSTGSGGHANIFLSGVIAHHVLEQHVRLMASIPANSPVTSATHLTGSGTISATSWSGGTSRSRRTTRPGYSRTAQSILPA